MNKWILFFGCLIAGSCAAVDISPVNPLVKVGDEVSLMCRTDGRPLDSSDCAWTSNSRAIRIKDGTQYNRFGNLERGECGVKFVATENDGGKWVCTVFSGDTNDKGATGETNVTLFELPVVSLVPAGDTVQVVAEEETMITCRAENGRPQPEIRWMIDDMPIESAETNVIDRTANGHVSLESKLLYRFNPNDHKKAIRCTAVITTGNEKSAVATLQVLFPPQPEQQETIQYGFVVGQPGSVVVNISANPPPTDLTWYIGDVEISGLGGTSSDKHFTTKMVSSEDVLHRAILNITQLTQVDASQVYVLKAKSVINGDDYYATYKMRLSSEAEPVREAANAGGSATAGIIIAIIAILLILIVVFIARSKGLLCFKPRTRADSEAQISPDTVQNGKDKEHHGHVNETVINEKADMDKPTLIEEAYKEQEENAKKDKDTPV